MSWTFPRDGFTSPEYHEAVMAWFRDVAGVDPSVVAIDPAPVVTTGMDGRHRLTFARFLHGPDGRAIHCAGGRDHVATEWVDITVDSLPPEWAEVSQ